jgi:hypothetical protein
VRHRGSVTATANPAVEELEQLNEGRRRLLYHVERPSRGDKVFVTGSGMVPLMIWKTAAMSSSSRCSYRPIKTAIPRTRRPGRPVLRCASTMEQNMGEITGT